MKLVYLESSLSDIEWMRFYYTHIFPVGKISAKIHIKKTEQLIMDFPDIGTLFDNERNVREMVIHKTHFSFLYRLNEDRIEILRLWDQRNGDNKEVT